MDKLNVAIADDNEIMLQMLDHIVSSDEELQVVGKAGDGEELIEIIREKKPDVVLLDIIMPKLDGLTVMDRVNQDKDLKKPAFIVISAVSQEKMTEDVFDLGADYYILKPFDNETVVNRIKKVQCAFPAVFHTGTGTECTETSRKARRSIWSAIWRQTSRTSSMR